MKEAALFTDGRYFLQASQQLDENWTLMKQGLPGRYSVIECHYTPNDKGVDRCPYLARLPRQGPFLSINSLQSLSTLTFCSRMSKAVAR